MLGSGRNEITDTKKTYKEEQLKFYCSWQCCINYIRENISKVYANVVGNCEILGHCRENCEGDSLWSCCCVVC